MPGPRIKSGGDPGICLLKTRRRANRRMDGRVKPGHDVNWGASSMKRLDRGTGVARRTDYRWKLALYSVALSAFAASISSAVIRAATDSRMSRAFGLSFSAALWSQA